MEPILWKFGGCSSICFWFETKFTRACIWANIRFGSKNRGRRKIAQMHILVKGLVHFHTANVNSGYPNYFYLCGCLLSFSLILANNVDSQICYYFCKIHRSSNIIITHSLTINFISFRFQILFSMFTHFVVHGIEFSDSAVEIRRNGRRKKGRKLVS